jgi:hypothetical protein
MRFPLHLSILAALLALPARSAPAKRPVPEAAPGAAGQPSTRLLSLSVAPTRVSLSGPRSEQGLVVTGSYSDGSQKDLTGAAAYRVSRTAVVAIETDAGRRVVHPLADGEATVTVSTPGVTPVPVAVEVRNSDAPAPVSFRDEVVPALTKAGCSQGICHGTPTGKGGFRLSLQGYAPEMDYQSIAREGGRRRVNPADPGASLLLLKPMVGVPHAGGKRLSAEMPEFKVISRWIAEGAHDDPTDAPVLQSVEVLPGRRSMLLPNAKQQIAVVAHFSDGSVRDVTSLAKLTTSNEDAATVSREGLVEGQKRGDVAVLARYQYALRSLRLTFLENVPGFQWNHPPEANYIDRQVFDRLKLFQIPTSDLSPDTEFLRRAYLDTLGLLPTPEEVRSFLAECGAERAATHHGDTETPRGEGERKTNGKPAPGAFSTPNRAPLNPEPRTLNPAPKARARLIDALTQRPEFADYWALKWSDVLRIQDEMLKDSGTRAYHKWVRESIAQNKPMDQFVRELLTASGPALADPPANYFRAVHDPEQLSEATAQLFLGVRMSCAKCHNHPFERWTQDEYYQLAAFFADVRRRGGPNHDEETVYLDPNGEVRHPRTGQVMAPKLLGAEFPKIQPGQDARAVLAAWITRKDNPFFAKSIVNRVWANMLGRGIVEPIDDFRDSNPPVNEGLLEALAKDFADHNFDFRYLVRTIMSSRAYQLTARTVPLNKDDTVYYSHALTQRIPAEPLADAISQFLGVPAEFPGYPKGTRATQVAGTNARTSFLKVFGRPDRNLSCECEREKDPNLFQALTLITDREIQSRLRSDSGRIAMLARSSSSNEQALEELYLASLSRPPTDNEKRQLLSYLGKATDRRQALEDVGWALMNSKEFQFRH